MPACAELGKPRRKSANALPSANPAAEEVYRGENVNDPRAFGDSLGVIGGSLVSLPLETVRPPESALAEIMESYR